MSLHDAYARVTPFELAFPDPGAVDALVRRIDEEAEGRGGDPADPHAFLTMGAVADFVRGLCAEDDAGAIHRFGTLVFHGVHFARAGAPLYLLATSAARYLVEGAPPGPPRPPAPAGYLQLPQHLFWAGGDERTGPESVDGVFWTATPAGVLHALLATGLRDDRAGVGVVPLPTAPLADAPEWLRVEVRDGGRDFANVLPGGELDGLYSFQAAGEVLKLLGRFFAYVGGRPRAEPRFGPDRDAEAEQGDRERPAPRRSVLPYHEVTLHD